MLVDRITRSRTTRPAIAAKARRVGGSLAHKRNGVRAPSEARYRSMLAVLMQFRVLIASMHRHYRRVERACGVSGADVWAMEQLAVTPGLKVGDLARELAVHQSTASNMVENLVRDGLVERRKASQDQRNVHLYLSPRGRSLVRRAPVPHRGALQVALVTLPPERLRALHADLAWVIARMAMRERVAGDMVLAQRVGAPRR
jgi:DNA-binding MarR family transcriptional regulator